jgi:hypothetical protein
MKSKLILFLLFILWFLIAWACLQSAVVDFRSRCQAVADAKGYDGEIQIYNYTCRVEYNGEFIDLESAKDLTP